MGSNSNDVQLAQKERAEHELEARLATLTERGRSPEQAKKDRMVRHLRADIKSFRKRITTIKTQAETLISATAKKAARLAEPKKKKAKQAAPPPAATGKKKKKS